MLLKETPGGFFISQVEAHAFLLDMYDISVINTAYLHRFILDLISSMDIFQLHVFKML